MFLNKGGVLIQDQIFSSLGLFQFSTPSVNIFCCVGFKCSLEAVDYHHGIHATIAYFGFSWHPHYFCGSCISKLIESKAYTWTTGKEGITGVERSLPGNSISIDYSIEVMNPENVHTNHIEQNDYAIFIYLGILYVYTHAYL